MLALLGALEVGFCQNNHGRAHELNGRSWDFWFSVPGTNYYLSNDYIPQGKTYRSFYIWIQNANSKPGEPRSYVVKGGVGCVTEIVQTFDAVAYDINNKRMSNSISLPVSFPFSDKIRQKYCQGIF
ncbi:MAG: hypothetical protein ACK421_09420 [Pseudanabaenaceae cyanobacterium]